MSSIAAVQLVANQTDYTVDHSDPDPDGAESHNNLNTTDRCCFLADSPLAQTNCVKMTEMILLVHILCIYSL